MVIAIAGATVWMAWLAREAGMALGRGAGSDPSGTDPDRAFQGQEMIPDDTSLTEDGLAPPQAGRILLIACGALGA